MSLRNVNILLVNLGFSVILFFYSCEYLSKPQNLELIADAGPDKTTIVGSYVVLDGSDSQGNMDRCKWEEAKTNPSETTLPFLSGVINNNNSPSLNPRIGFIKEGVYKFYLTLLKDIEQGNISDSDSGDTDTVIVRVLPNKGSKIKDPRLEIAIRQNLQNKIGDLNQNELLKVKKIISYSVADQYVVESLRGIEYCKNLEYLIMGHQKIKDLSPLENLSKLKELSLTQNYTVKDISPLKNLTNLAELNLSSNSISDISALKNLTSLKILDLQYNNTIKNISVLSNLTNLKSIKIAQSSISDVSPLGKCASLEVLWIDGCGIKDISSFEKLVNLKKIHMMSNKIEDISSLSGLNKLEYIVLDLNMISNISSLKLLENLQYVRLWDNKIKDIYPLVQNPKIDSGDIVALKGNPLNEKSLRQYIPQLKARGVYVSY